MAGEVLVKKKALLQSCFFVDRGSIKYYEYDSADVIDVKLSSEVVVDLEIVSQSSLERVLKTWSEQLKIIPGNTTLFLDDSVCFHKNLPAVPADLSSDPAVQEFIETIPFADLETKVFPMEKGAILTAVNKGFMRPIVTTLENIGFKVLSISPAYILGHDFSKTPFSKEIASPVLDRNEFLMQYSFLSPEEVEQKLTEEKPFMSITITPKVIAMGVVFILLIVVLVVLLILQSKEMI